MKGEESVQDDKDHNYDFVDEFLEEAIRSSSLYDSRHDAKYEYWTTDHFVHATFNMGNSFPNSGIKLPILPGHHHISILDDGADTCVLGQGRKVLSKKGKCTWF